MMLHNRMKAGLPPLEQPLHPEEVKAALRMKFGSLMEFEQAKGLPYRSASQVLGGKAIRRAAEAIAEELNIPLHRVTLRYYNLATSVSHRAKAGVAHSLNEKAA